VWQGAVVGEFTGAMPESDVRPWIEELVRATGAVPPAADADAESEPPAVDPALAAAADAFERGDYDAAERGYAAILAERPADQLAAGALAGVRLYKRAEQLDADAARATAQAQPDDVAAQCAASDVDVLDGLTAEAFQRLVAVVARTSGADRDKARLHLLQLFDVVGHDDPQVVTARAALSRALF